MEKSYDMTGRKETSDSGNEKKEHDADNSICVTYFFDDSIRSGRHKLCSLYSTDTRRQQSPMDFIMSDFKRGLYTEMRENQENSRILSIAMISFQTS